MFADILSAYPGIPGKLITLAVAIVVTAIVEHILVGIVRRAFERSSMSEASIFVNIVRVIVWFVALLSVLQPVFGIEPTVFVTTVGVITIAISLGLQDTLSNIIAGLGITMTQVISPGDMVELDGEKGQVEDVTWRNTTLRDSNGSTKVVPNSLLNKSSLVKLSDAAADASSFVLLVDTGADLAQVADDIVGTAQEVLGGRLQPIDGCVVRLQGSNAAGRGLAAKVILHLTDWTAAASATDEVVRALSGREWLI